MVKVKGEQPDEEICKMRSGEGSKVWGGASLEGEVHHFLGVLIFANLEAPRTPCQWNIMEALLGRNGQ